MFQWIGIFSFRDSESLSVQVLLYSRYTLLLLLKFCETLLYKVIKGEWNDLWSVRGRE